MPKARALRAETYHDPTNYRPPLASHSHAGGEPPTWHKDIDYATPWSRRAALLVGDREQSYVWTTPTIRRMARLALPIGNPLSTLSHLLDTIEAVP